MPKQWWYFKIEFFHQNFSLLANFLDDRPQLLLRISCKLSYKWMSITKSKYACVYLSSRGAKVEFGYQKNPVFPAVVCFTIALT